MADKPNMMTVNREHPCPVCKKHDRCKIGLTTVLCWRVEGARPIKGGTGWLHRIDGPSPAYVPPKKASITKSEWYEPAAAYHANLHPEMEIQLARQLGLPDDGLKCLGLVGYRDEPDQRSFSYTFPERDGTGKVIGINRRFKDGRKMHIPGGARGLTLPNEWDELKDGPLFIVEGPTDTAAMICAGLNAWGRPSNTGGVEMLSVALKNVPEARPCVIVGENDKKPDGLWPGLVGAISVAGGLVERGRKNVFWALAPTDFKDVREYLTSEMFSETPWEARGASLLADLAPHTQPAALCPEGYSEAVAAAKKAAFDPERWQY